MPTGDAIATGGQDGNVSTTTNEHLTLLGCSLTFFLFLAWPFLEFVLLLFAPYVNLLQYANTIAVA